MRATAGEILTILRDKGTCSRAELARITGLSTAATSKLTAELLEVGVIKEGQNLDKGVVGRPPIDLSLNHDSFLIIGVHISKGTVEIVVADTGLNVLQSTSFSFSRDIEINDLVKHVAREVDILIEKSTLPRSRFIGVGLAVPGAVDREGRYNLFSIFAQWNNVPFADLLEEQLNLPVMLEHNAASIALAESSYGAGREYQRLLYIYMGKGIGAGITNRVGQMGPRACQQVELGHVIVDPNGETCQCGCRGCLETVFSEGPLLRILQSDVVPEAGLIQEAMRSDQWESCYQSFLQALAAAVILLFPDAIVLGGHLGVAPETLFSRLHSDIAERVVWRTQEAQMRVIRTSYLSAAGAVGASSMGLEHFVFRNPQLMQTCRKMAGSPKK